MWHCNVQLFLLAPDHIHSLLQVVIQSAILVRSCFANPAKVKKVITFLIKRPNMKAPQAMKLIKFSNDEVANLSLHCFIQQSLPGKMVKGLKVHVSGLLLLSLTQPDQSERFCNCTINVTGVCDKEGPSSTGLGACEHVMAVTPFPFPPWPSPVALPQGWPTSRARLTAAT